MDHITILEDLEHIINGETIDLTSKSLSKVIPVEKWVTIVNIEFSHASLYVKSYTLLTTSIGFNV